MRKKLTSYYGLIERGTEELFREEISDALRLEPVVREILKRLDPELVDVKIDAWENWAKTLDYVDFGLGIIAAREACAVELAADIPVLPADQFHRWVWHAARTLWDSAHYRHAVQAAATAVNDHAQNKLGRRDIADTKLMQEAFSLDPPEPGRPRLRCLGDPGNPTTQSRQRGALQYAAGCCSAIRNPATHEQEEWDQQVALEYLASLSVLARWIDDWKLVTAP
jgi:hypothetical protein